MAHDLQLSYYDHPPLQYWIAHLFMPVLGDGRAARLPFIAMFAVSSWLMYRLAQVLFGTRAGLAALVAVNCSAFYTFAGGWVLPDGPLMLALLAAALVLARHFFAAEMPQAAASASWLWAGFWIGIAALAKYHAILFALGLLFFIATDARRRAEMRHAAPWLGLTLALLLSLPVLVWNAQHEWISIAYQAGRGRPAGGPHPAYLFANLIGQALWILPWIFLPMLVATWQACRDGPSVPRSWFCLCLGLPAVILFTLIPVWGRLGLPHWQMPGWLMLYPVLGNHAVSAHASLQLRRAAMACAVLLAMIGSLLLAQAVTGCGRLLAPKLFAYGDPTLDAFEWNQLPAVLRSRGLLRPGVFLITTSWMAAGRIDAALHHSVPVVVFGGNPKEFGLRHRPGEFLGRNALFIAPANAYPTVVQELRPHFESLEELAPVALGRSGLQEIRLRLACGHRLTRSLPAGP